MKTVVVKDVLASIGPGTEMVLTDEQLSARAHNVEVIEKVGKDRTRVRANAVLQFKIGEKLQLAGDLPKNLARTDEAEIEAKATKAARVTKADKAAIEAAKMEGYAAGRAEMLAEVVARNGVFEAADEAAAATAKAQAAFDAETDSIKKAGLQTALDDAKAIQKKADDLVAALPELKA